MLCNSISVYVKVYPVQLKYKSTVGVLHVILRNFRTATFDNNFGELLLKRKQSRRRAFVISDFHFFLGSYLLSHKTVFFLHKFSLSGAFQFDYVIHFYKPKKGLSSPDFSGRDIWLLLGR